MLGRWALRVGYLRGVIYAAGGDMDAGLQPAPLQGWARAAGLTDAGLWLTWSASLAVLALWVFGATIGAGGLGGSSAPRSNRGVGVRLPAASSSSPPSPPRSMAMSILLGPCIYPIAAWVALVMVLVTTYPEGRMGYTRLYAAATLASVLTGGAAFVLWLVRAWGREGLSVTRGCVALLIGCEAIGLAGPYVRGIYYFWWLDNAVQLIMYSALVFVQGGVLWMATSSRS